MTAYKRKFHELCTTASYQMWCILTLQYLRISLNVFLFVLGQVNLGFRWHIGRLWRLQLKFSCIWTETNRSLIFVRWLGKLLRRWQLIIRSNTRTKIFNYRFESMYRGLKYDSRLRRTKNRFLRRRFARTIRSLSGHESRILVLSCMPEASEHVITVAHDAGASFKIQRVIVNLVSIMRILTIRSAACL